MPLARVRKGKVALWKTIHTIPKNAYRTLRLLQVNSGYQVLRGVMALLLAFIALILPPSGVGNSFPVQLLSAFLLIVSLAVISRGWTHFRETNKGRETKMASSMFLSGVSSALALALWDFGSLSFGTVLAISIASTVTLAIIYAAKIGLGSD